LISGSREGHDEAFRVRHLAIIDDDRSSQALFVNTGHEVKAIFFRKKTTSGKELLGIL
jgi:hypothetical protein